MSADTTPERSEFTPTTAEVRERFIDGFPMDTWVVARAELGADFDRWLAAYAVEVARRAAEKGWDECHAALSYYIVRRDLNVQGLEQPSNPYRAEQIGEN